VIGRPQGAAARRYATARPAGRATPWREASFCVVDLEATGLNPRTDEIVGYAAVPVEAGRIKLAGSVAGLARPRVRMPPETVLIHGLRPADVADAPPLEEGLDRLLDVLAGRILVAHCAWVERGFLGRALRARRGVRLRGPILDTAVLGRLLALERHDVLPPTAALGALARGLGLPVHRPHDALGDALTTAQVFLALAAQLDRREPRTVGSLARAERRVRSAALYNPVTPAEA
jgi:DNA polymerase III subunit epsilon